MGHFHMAHCSLLDVKQQQNKKRLVLIVNIFCWHGSYKGKTKIAFNKLYTVYPKLCFKDVAKKYLRDLNNDINSLKTIAADRLR